MPGATYNYSFNFNEEANGPSQLTVATAPEASTWAMMLAGFAGIAFAGFRSHPRATATA
jgi:hypothetical protein